MGKLIKQAYAGKTKLFLNACKSLRWQLLSNLQQWYWCCNLATEDKRKIIVISFVWDIAKRDLKHLTIFIYSICCYSDECLTVLIKESAYLHVICVMLLTLLQWSVSGSFFSILGSLLHHLQGTFLIWWS